MNAQQIENANIKNDDKTIDELASDIQKIRAKICNVFLITFAVIAIPSLTASLYRITAIGWQPIMTIHIVLAISLWGIVIFRNKVSYNIQASFIVIIFLIIGLGGIYQFGLVAGSIAFLVISSPIATLLFGVKIGIATLTIALSGSIVIGILVVSGNLQHGVDLPAYAIASSSWFNSIIGWGLASTALTASLYVFNKKLIRAIAISKQHQEALQLSKERLNMVLEGSEQGFWDWNIDTDEVKRNDRWAQMLGYTTIKEFEDNTDTWTNSIYPDDRDAAWASINDHLEGRTTCHKLEYRMLTKDGGYRWILDHAKIVQRDSSGRPLRMSGTHTNITERKNAEDVLKKSEQSLNDAQRIAHLGSWEWDITNNLITWSDELCRIYGLVPGEIKPSFESFLSLLNVRK
jgi:PAS domain S-box-containing protein